MSDEVLSADEVDALLDGVSSGKIGDGGNGFSELEATPYDLTATEHIARSDIPSMDLLNQGFARYLKQSFCAVLRDGIDIEVGDVVEQKFADYVASLDEPTMLYLVDIPSVQNQAIIVLSAELIRKYVDIYFGGGTKALERSPREGFTSAEQRVASQILDFTLKDFVRAWEPIIPIKVEATKSESSPHFCKFIESAEPIVVSKFQIKLDEDDESSLSCVLTGSMLGPLYEKMDASTRGSQPEHRTAWTRKLKERLKDINITLATPIAKRKFTLGKLVRLQSGDIIPIELDSTVSLKAGKTTLYTGKFGVSKNKNSIQIESSTLPKD